MAETALSATQLVKNTQSADLPVTSMTAIDPDKTMVVAYPEEGKLLLVLNNTTAGAKDFTISAGNGIEALQGDLVMSLAQDDVRYLVVGSSRFKHLDNSGKLQIEFADSTTGFVGAFLLP